MNVVLRAVFSDEKIEELYDKYQQAKHELISALMGENLELKEEQPNQKTRL